MEYNLGLYVTYNISKYKTSKEWGFLIAPIESDSSDDAVKKGNDILNTMTAPGVPGVLDGTFYCTYETNQPDVKAVAAKKSDIFSITAAQKLLR